MGQISVEISALAQLAQPGAAAFAPGAGHRFDDPLDR
jgi:hypothetical protein